ncbi:MAG: hypothetical protein JWQ63_3645 [Mucilaginibacter sp.]|nr:hypothetical protein [Mucilaginibacter sp.]
MNKVTLIRIVSKKNSIFSIQRGILMIEPEAFSENTSLSIESNTLSCPEFAFVGVITIPVRKIQIVLKTPSHGEGATVCEVAGRGFADTARINTCVFEFGNSSMV